MTAARSARIDAPAKVNLFLHVGGRRPDGYHELRTLFQALQLADTVRVRRAPRGPRAVTLQVDGPDLGPPAENLAVKAAEAFLDAFGVPGSVHVELSKRIPAGGGLGGGSSDAAAVLRLLGALTEMPGTPCSAREQTYRIASELGSDVAFFLQPTPLALGLGRGEVLTARPALPRRDVVLALPPVHVSTAEAYRALARAPLEPTGATPHSPRDDGLPSGWAAVEAGAVNDFGDVVSERHPEIRASLDALASVGASTVLLSGSGAASFGLFGERSQAVEAAERLSEELGWPFVATATRTEMPVPELDEA